MQITVQQDDLIRLLKGYVEHFGIDMEGKTFDVDFIAGRTHPSRAILTILEEKDTFDMPINPEGEVEASGLNADKEVDPTPEEEKEPVFIGVDMAAEGTESKSVSDEQQDMQDAVDKINATDDAELPISADLLTEDEPVDESTTVNSLFALEEPGENVIVPSELADAQSQSTAQLFS